MLTAEGLPSGLDSWTIAYLVVYTIAILATIWRFYSKIRRRQLYWDDFWASVALSSTLVTLAVMIVLSTIRLEDMGLTSRSFVLWVDFITLPSTVWSSRISISMSMVRVIPLGRKRTFAKVCCCVLGCCWIAICLQKIWMCAGMTAPTIPWCPANFTTLTPALSLTLNVLADMFLVISPALILAQMKLDKNQWWLLIACFSTSFFVMIIDCCYCAYFLRGSLGDAEHLAYLEIAVTLLLCNTTAFAPYAYRRCDIISGSFSLGLPVSDFLAPDAASNSYKGKTHDVSSGPDQSVVLDTVGFSAVSGISFYTEDDQASWQVREDGLSEKKSVFEGHS